MKKSIASSQSIANALGTLGYISIVFQWVWALLLLSYPIITQNPDTLLPHDISAEAPSPLTIDPSIAPLATLVAIIVTVCVLVLTVIVIARLPKTVGKRASGITKTAANVVIPTVTQHKKITKKERLRLSSKIVALIKLTAIIAPLALLCFVATIDELPRQAIWVTGIFTSVCSLIYFALQYLIAAVKKLPIDKLW